MNNNTHENKKGEHMEDAAIEYVVYEITHVFFGLCEEDRKILESTGITEYDNDDWGEIGSAFDQYIEKLCKEVNYAPPWDVTYDTERRPTGRDDNSCWSLWPVLDAEQIMDLARRLHLSLKVEDLPDSWEAREVRCTRKFVEQQSGMDFYDACELLGYDISYSCSFDYLNGYEMDCLMDKIGKGTLADSDA